MKKKFRIKNTNEFNSIIQAKRFRSCGSFVVYAKVKCEDNYRIGITVPKKLGNAVVRNKTKRQIKSMLRNIKNYTPKYDLIILVRKKYFEQSFIENQKDLEKLMKTVKI